MSLIHPLSAPAAPACLELFNVPDTQTAVSRRYIVEVPPTSSQTTGPIEFFVRSDSPEYCDLSGIKWYGRVRIVHADGSKMTADDVAILGTLYMHTMIKQVDVKIGNKILSLPHQMYPYKAMLKVALRNGEESKSTQYASQGYFKHVSGSMDAVQVADNEEYRKRGKLFELSKWVDFEGNLLEDCLEVDRLLLNNVPLCVKLTLSSPEFVVRAADDSKKFKFELADVMLKIPMVTVSPGVILGHANALKEGNALYPFWNTHMLNQSVSKGQSSLHLHNLCPRSVPSRLVFCMVTAEAYNGKHSKNPFKFEPFNISEVSLVVNESTVGGQPLKINFDPSATEGRDYVAAYNNLYSATGTEGKDFGNGISLDDFKDGYTIFCFNLEPFDNPGPYFNLMKTGFVRLSITFSKPLEETIVLIVYTENQDIFQIDAARNVLVY